MHDQGANVRRIPCSVLHGHWTPQHMYVVGNGKLIVRKENVIPLEDLRPSAQLVERYHLQRSISFQTLSLNVGKSKLFCPADLNSSNIA